MRAAAATPLPIAYRVGRLAGLAAYFLWPRGRRSSQAALGHVAAGDTALARRYARSSFAYYGTYLVDFLRFGTITPDDIRRTIDFDDWAPIEAQRTGNGAVFVTLHFGNWDLAGALLAQRWPMTAIADSFGSAAVDRLVMDARRRLGMNIVVAGHTGPEVLRALRRNDVLAVLADVPQAGGGVRVDFFGAPLEMPDGPARIALRVGAPVIVGGVWRTRPAEARYTAVAEVVRFQPTGDREHDVQALTQATAYALERLVRRAPEQWYVFRGLWLDPASASPAVVGIDALDGRDTIEGAPVSPSAR